MSRLEIESTAEVILSICPYLTQLNSRRGVLEEEEDRKNAIELLQREIRMICGHDAGSESIVCTD